MRQLQIKAQMKDKGRSSSEGVNCMCGETEFYFDWSWKPSRIPFKQELNTARKQSTASLGQVTKDHMKIILNVILNELNI
jgi:hypothetical protein